MVTVMQYKKLGLNLYSADVHYGKIDLKSTHRFSCFFIVQHTDDKKFIKDQAIQLLLAGCRNFDFYGKMESLWHSEFDEADILLFPDSTAETVALTSGWETLVEFVDALHAELSLRSFVPHDYYLLYDDAALYKEALRLLDTFNNSEKECSF